MAEWIEYLFGVAGAVLAITLAFQGSRQMVTEGIRRTSVLRILGGIAITASLSGSAYLRYDSAATALIALNRPTFEKLVPLPDDWGSSCCLEKREEETKRIVRAAFVESGQLHTYFNSAGARVLFAPSDRDLHEREQRVVMNSEIRDLTERYRAQVVQPLVALFFGVLFGLGNGGRRERSSANSTPHTDAGDASLVNQNSPAPASGGRER